MTTIRTTIHFNTDVNGLLDRECPSCKVAFKASKDHDPMHCPKCGTEAPGDQWFTPEQIAHINDTVGAEATNFIGGELDRMFRRGATKGLTLKRGTPARHPSPPPARASLPFVSLCPACAERFETSEAPSLCPCCGADMRVA